MAVTYTAQVHSTNGREGHVRSNDGALDLATRKPLATGDAGGTNPEQLFAAAYAACYGGSVHFVADKQKLTLPDGWSVDAAVSMNLEGGGVFLSVALTLSLPGFEREKAERLAQTAHGVCAYSKAVKGNVEVELKVEV